MSKCVLLVFSSRTFIVFGLTSRSLIHFYFIFVCGVRECSNSILLHVSVQFSQHPLVMRLSYSIVHFCLLCHRLIDHRCMGLSLGFLSCSIDLCFCFCASGGGLVAKSCLTCDPMNCSLPGSSVHRTSQARILEWVAISFSRGSSRHSNRTSVS